MTHPTREDWMSYLYDELSPEQRSEMSAHLALTTQEVVARLQRKWAADVTAYDAVPRHILHFSDTLADGIVKQFPNRFR